MSNIKRLSTVLFFLLVFISVHADETPTIWVEKDTVNVGTVNTSVRTISLEVSVSNLSDVPLTIKSIKTDCLCTTVDYDKSPIPASGNRLIKVTIELPKYYRGEMEKKIIVMSDASEPKKEVTFVINVSRL